MHAGSYYTSCIPCSCIFTCSTISIVHKVGGTEHGDAQGYHTVSSNIIDLFSLVNIAAFILTSFPIVVSDLGLVRLGYLG